MQNNRTAIALFVLSLLMCIITIKTIATIPATLGAVRSDTATITDSTTIRRLALINRATAEFFDTIPAHFTGGFDTPFKRWDEKKAPAAFRGNRSARPARAMLSLKGILTKDRPLAILDNGSGETQIRAAGEQAFDQSIISIKNNRVTIRDHLGTYEITVEEY